MTNPNDAQRPKGFYWVRLHEWEIMRWDGKHWCDTDGDWYVGMKMEIDERRLERPAPQPIPAA